MDVFELSDALWSGRRSTEEFHPLVPHDTLTEIRSDLAFISSFANVTVIDTPDGLVLVDTGSFLLAEGIHKKVRTWRPSRLARAVYSHGHVDHVFGVPYFDVEAEERGWERPLVIAHEAVAARFARYVLTRGYNEIINRRQFRAPNLVWPSEFRYPDIEYSSSMEFDVGGVVVEVNHARGETDDHSWTWIPSARTICCGDLFIWASPNAGNPQKVQRYPAEWAVALRDMASRHAEFLLPGHGVPVAGERRVEEALTNTAAYLESILSQTLDHLNAGSRLSEAIAEVAPPPELADLPYLRPVYDEPEFIVHNIWRLYGGWYDGNPAHLKPAPEAALSREIVELAGGPSRLVDRALALLSDGEDGSLRLAAHLIEFASQCSGDPAVLDARKRIFSARAEQSTSTMAKGIFAWAAGEYDSEAHGGHDASPPLPE